MANERSKEKSSKIPALFVLSPLLVNGYESDFLDFLHPRIPSLESLTFSHSLSFSQFYFFFSLLPFYFCQCYSLHFSPPFFYPTKILARREIYAPTLFACIMRALVYPGIVRCTSTSSLSSSFHRCPQRCHRSTVIVATSCFKRPTFKIPFLKYIPLLSTLLSTISY